MALKQNEVTEQKCIYNLSQNIRALAHCAGKEQKVLGQPHDVMPFCHMGCC